MWRPCRVISTTCQPRFPGGIDIFTRQARRGVCGFTTSLIYFRAQDSGSIRRHLFILVRHDCCFSGQVTAEEFYCSDDKHVYTSLYIVADFDSKAGSKLLKEAVASIVCRLHLMYLYCVSDSDQQHPESHTRISFIHNPQNASSGSPSESQRVSYLISQLLNGHNLVSMSPAKVLGALGLDVAVPTGDRLQVDLPHDGLLAEQISMGDFDTEVYTRFVTSSRLVARELHIAPGEQTLIVNGRVRVSPSHLELYTYVNNGYTPNGS
jgi:hypothetical protein